MFIIKRCFDDGHGNLIYKSSCIIGIYDDFLKAYDDLLLNDTYFFSMMTTKKIKK